MTHEPVPEPTLVRAIGPWALGANAVNLTVGAGIFALPAAVAAILGPSAILAYLLCGALIVLVLACFAEVGSQVTRSGGAVAYLDEAFGPFAGFLATMVFTVGFCAGSSAAIAHVMLDAIAVVVPALSSGPVRAAAPGCASTTSTATPPPRSTPPGSARPCPTTRPAGSSASTTAS